MFVSRDGTVTGSIDVSRLDQIEPKTDEARAQLDALKAEATASAEQAARDAERMSAQARAQSQAFVDPEERERLNREEQADAERQQRAADQRASQAGQSQAGQSPSAEVTQLRADAEKAGVTVDQRWGADRLRQEIASAQSAKSASSAQKKG